MVKVRENLVGKIFGKLTVLEQAEDYINPKGKHIARWLCLCECGNQTIVLGSDLNRKDNRRIVSCGHCYSNYDLSGDYGVCNMKDGYICIFDIEDYDKIKEYHWHKNSGGYAVSNIKKDGKWITVQMHRLIMNVSDDIEVDHIHGNKLDNRKSELRVITQANNKKNKSKYKNNTSGYKGVSWKKDNQKWVANIQCNGQFLYLGSFDTAYEAHICYEEMAKKLFKEYKREENYDNITIQNE